jgi:hypothetical protein
VPARALAEKVTGVSAADAIPAVREYWPSELLPSVQLVSWASPSSSVTTVVGDTDASRSGVKVMVTPGTGFPAASLAITEGGGLTGELTVP